METIEIYANYGVLTAEKRTVYTFGVEHPHAVCSDKMTVAIPEGWELFQNYVGQTMISAPWGWNYDVNEILMGDERPYFYALDSGMKAHRVYLEEVAKKDEDS